jgi:hypothetical protein
MAGMFQIYAMNNPNKGIETQSKQIMSESMSFIRNNLANHRDNYFHVRYMAKHIKVCHALNLAK